MMFSATMTSENRGLFKKFISDPHEIRVDEESKLDWKKRRTESSTILWVLSNSIRLWSS